MKRSAAVNLFLVTAAAAAMTACKEKPTRYCVDTANQVVDDWQCQEKDGQQNATHHWYYGGAHGIITRGTRLTGGSTSEPVEGFVTPSGSVRGGIGEAGENAAGHGEGAHGAGGGE